MGRKIFILILILLVLSSMATYTVYQYRTQKLEEQKVNKQYAEYYNIELLGTQLISLINKTMDLNEKNEIPKDDLGKYADTQGKAIIIYVKFIYNDETTTISMEDIAKMGTESFIRLYSTENFKCTEVNYYDSTNNVKSLTFEEI